MLLLAATGRRVVPALVQTPWAAAAAAAAPGRGLAAKAKADKNKPKDKQRVGGGKQQAGGKKAAGDQGGKAAKAKAALQLLDVPLQARNLPDLTREEMLERMQMAKAWSRYSLREHHAFLKRVDDIRQCAIEALDELKALNPALYEAARQPETSDFPLTAKEAMDAPPPSLLGLSQTDGAAHTIESQAGGGATLSLADLRDRAIAAEKKKAAEGSSGGAAGSSSGSSSNSASGR